MLAILTVNSMADSHINTDGVLTLREAIEVVSQGNTNGLDNTTIVNQISGQVGSNDNIQFASSLNGQTILLNRSNGHLGITKSLTIDASGLSNGVTIDANDPTPGSHTATGIRIFAITVPISGVTPIVAMSHLKLTGGDVILDGGAIFSAGLLTLTDCTITNNSADRGGGVFVEVAGTGARNVLTIEDCLFEGNEAFTGGGIALISGINEHPTSDTAVITRTKFQDNHADSGGGLFADLHGATMSITGSSFLENNDPDKGVEGGGALAKLDGAELTIAESNFAHNRADLGSGGGLFAEAINGSELLVSGSKLSGNTSLFTGGALRAKLSTSSTLTVQGSEISENNMALGDGGGVWAKSYSSDPNVTFLAITISESLVSGNTAGNRGGGLYLYNNDATGTLIRNSQITGNHGGTNGGGIYAFVDGIAYAAVVRDIFTITGSTVDGNDTANEGGGMFVCMKHGGRFVATNSTFSGNKTLDEFAGEGGGLLIAHPASGAPYDFVEADLRNITVTQNKSATGGGIRSKDLPFMNVRVANSIISQNFNKEDPSTRVPNNLVGRVDTDNLKYNLIGTGSIVKKLDGTLVPLTATPPTVSVQSLPNIISDAPGLSVLGDHGGPTPTHRLEAGSPAIDAGSNALATIPLSGSPETLLPTDQRGEKFTRFFDIAGVGNSGTGPTGFAVDIGAYEINPPKVIEVRVSKSGTPSTEYSFLGHVGSGEQLRTVPVGGADTVTVRFSEVVSNLAIGSVTLNGLTTGSTLTPASGGFTPGADMGAWRFNAAFPLDQYVLNVFDTVTAAGAALDGNWVNPLRLTTTNPDVSRFPSGDGTPGGAFHFAFTILPGDANRSNDVSGADYLIWSLNLGLQNRTFETGDFDGTGTTGSADLAIYNANYGRIFWVLVFADFNGDFTVNTTDLMIWQTNFGRTNADHATGDADGDGDVDGSDLNLWYRQQGLFLRWAA